MVLEAITQAGYKPGEQIAIALDPAASEFYDKDKKKYVFKKSDKSERTSEQMVEFWANWVRQYPIVSIEDGMAEDDWDGWKMLTDELGEKIQLVGDDLFVTNTERLQKGIEKGVANSILIKVNQIGTLTRDARSDRAGAAQRLHVRSFRIARAKPKIRSSPIWRWRPARVRSRPARLAAPTASRSTTSCCASKKNWARREVSRREQKGVRSAVTEWRMTPNRWFSPFSMAGVIAPAPKAMPSRWRASRLTTGCCANIRIRWFIPPGLCRPAGWADGQQRSRASEHRRGPHVHMDVTRIDLMIRSASSFSIRRCWRP